MPPAADGATQRSHLQGLLVCTLLGVGVAILAGRTLGVARNTLENNGRWRVSKTELEIPILGARSFYSGRQALAGGALDLGAWHGFQQVVYREALELDVLELDFRLLAGSYLVVLFGGTPEGEFAGLRLSAHDGFAPAFLEISASGEFLRKELIDAPPLEPVELHHLRLEPGRPVRALLDGAPFATFDTVLPARQLIGMRGGYAHLFVDRIVLRPRRGSPIVEGFNTPPGTRSWTLLLAAVLVGLPIALSFRLRRRRHLARRCLLVLAATELMGLAVLAAAQPLSSRAARRYPEPDSRLTALEEQARHELLDQREQRARAAYPVPPALHTARLVFVGSSQTEGVGAQREEETWVRRIERHLNSAARGGVTWECVNAGVSSARAEHLLPAVGRTWLHLGASALVIDLASNEEPQRRFSDRVRRMVTRSLESGISPLLVLEPNTPEHIRPALRRRQAALRRIAEELGVPWVDMQAYLDERYDEGFLWWDHVHLTSFGQRLMAEGVYAALGEHGIVPPPADG